VANEFPEFISVEEACRRIGGDKPIHPSTYYRGVRAGIYPAPVRTAPNVARIDGARLTTAVRDLIERG
jgi:hypothetical protein